MLRGLPALPSAQPATATSQATSPNTFTRPPGGSPCKHRAPGAHIQVGLVHSRHTEAVLIQRVTQQRAQAAQRPSLWGTGTCVWVWGGWMRQLWPHGVQGHAHCGAMPCPLRCHAHYVAMPITLPCHAMSCHDARSICHEQAPHGQSLAP